MLKQDNIESREVLKYTTLKEHYIELRIRLIICIITFVVTSVLCFFIADKIYAVLAQPLFAILGDDPNRKLIFTSLTEGFATYIKISFYAGFIVSFPMSAAQLYFFVAPGLYKKEKKVLIPYLISVPILFTLGGVLVYYLVIPTAWKFFISFESLSSSSMPPIVLEAKISEYLDLVLELIIGFGLAFQLPIILTLLTRVGVMSSRLLSQYRKYAIILVFILAAIMTPPDVISQVTLALPLMLLYEISIIICKFIEKRSSNA